MISEVWLNRFVVAIKELIAEIEELDRLPLKAILAVEEINMLLDLIGERDEDGHIN